MFMFLLYFFILFWMTFLSFFYKMYFGIFIFDSDFYNLITLYFVFFILFYYYFFCFDFFYLGSFFDFFLFWSLTGLMFYFSFFIVWICALLLFAFFRVVFLHMRDIWQSVLHFFFFFFVTLVILSSCFSFFFTLLLTPGFIWELYSVYFLLAPCIYFESLLCSDMYSNMFFILIFDDKLQVLSEICFEQYYDFLSNVQSNKFEVLNSIFFDLHVYISAVSFSESFVLRLYLKLFWGLGWFVFIFFIVVFSSRFFRFAYNFI